MRRATAIKNERLGKREYISERDGARPARSTTLRRDASHLLRYVLYTILYFDSFWKRDGSSRYVLAALSF